MDFQLSIISYHRYTSQIEVIKPLFSANNNAPLYIGRAEQCDWCLPDPERVISGQHAVIEKHQGKVIIKDLSTNGLFINRAVEPLGKNNHHYLSIGDVISLGDYEIEVQANTESKNTSQDNKLNNSEQNFNLEPSSKSVPLSDVNNEVFIGNIDDSFTSPQNESLDLMQFNETIPEDWSALFENPEESKQTLNSDIDENVELSSNEDTVFSSLDLSAPNAFESSATSSVESELDDEPESVSTELMAETSAAEEAAQKEVSLMESEPVSVPEHTAPSVEMREAVVDTSVLTPVIEKPQPTAASKPKSQVKAKSQPKAKPRPKKTKVTPEPVAKRVKPNVASSLPWEQDQTELLNAFIQGMNAHSQNHQIHPEMSEKWWFEMGESVYLLLTGLMTTLQKRADFKQSNRLMHTSFKRQENNPLKFSANFEDAIHNLYHRKSPSFLSAQRAIQEAFSDIDQHEKAMIYGTKGAVRGVMSALEPARIASVEAPEGVLSNWFGSKQKANNWQRYETLFYELESDLRQEQPFYLDDFVKHYEASLKGVGEK
ncbi:type VI secretion system-associated FHA domain protein TagH [Photobacterium jeanii]|nr:type VI secretion system-associated FHA domain protein TagH [Photobacterium jeanii]